MSVENVIQMIKDIDAKIYQSALYGYARQGPASRYTHIVIFGRNV